MNFKGLNGFFKLLLAFPDIGDREIIHPEDSELSLVYLS